MATDDKLDAILNKLDAIMQAQAALAAEQRILYRQIEALFALYGQIDFNAPLLDMRGWATSPDVLAVLMRWIQRERPAVIVELGGGRSTLVSAYACRQNGVGHVYAIDHDAHFAGLAREEVAAHGLSDHATIIHAPLVQHRIGAEAWAWYDVAHLPDLPPVDLLFVDGPAQHNHPQAMLRYPALPLLAERLADGALIVVDDAGREHERHVVERWLAEFNLMMLQDLSATHGQSDKGAKVLRLAR